MNAQYNLRDYKKFQYFIWNIQLIISNNKKKRKIKYLDNFKKPSGFLKFKNIYTCFKDQDLKTFNLQDIFFK